MVNSAVLNLSAAFIGAAENIVSPLYHHSHVVGMSRLSLQCSHLPQVGCWVAEETWSKGQALEMGYNNLILLQPHVQLIQFLSLVHIL